MNMLGFSSSVYFAHITCYWKSKSKSKSKLCYDRRSAGQSVLEKSTHLGLTTRYLLLVWQLRSCSCGAPSLTRGRVSLLFVLLALASAVFLGSESLGTRGHILLSQIWDFPFRHLLRLAGSRWRYSTPPPHEYVIENSSFCTTHLRHGPYRKPLLFL
jgi:hypothetical protein